MITLFSIPKSFSDPHINVIQRNAIKSWLELGGDVEIILVGDEAGISGVAQEYNLGWIENVERNKFATPLLSSAFSLARQKSKYNTLIYVNSDIILFSDLLGAIRQLPEKEFLAAGQRWDLDIKKQVDFSDKNWRQKLRDEIKREGKLHIPNGSDYFIFKKESFANMPPFAVGRVGWDNWLIHEANRQRMLTIDGSRVITAVHQNHDYSHQKEQAKDRFNSAEAKQNYALVANQLHRLEDLRYVLTKKGIKKIFVNKRKIRKIIKINWQRIRRKFLTLFSHRSYG